MKNRKNVLIVFAVLAILCLGIGYAELIDSLKVSGNVSASGSAAGSVIDEEQFDIQFVDESATIVPTHAVDGKDYITASATVDNVNTLASFEVNNLSTKGDKVVFNVTVKNVKSGTNYGAEIKYALTNGLATAYSAYFSVEVKWESVSTGGEISGDTVILDMTGDTAVLSVTIELIKTIPDANDVFSGSVTVDLSGKAIVRR